MVDLNQTTEQGNPLRWWVLIAAALGVFMTALDSNIVNVALPVMAQEFHISNGIQWVSLCYMLALVSLTAVAGRLSDMVGRKRVFLWGIIIFVVGSMLCGMATSVGQILVYRVIQGIGGAFIAAPIAAVATVLFPIHERGKAMGVVGVIGPLGALFGPGLGGFMIDVWGWPSLFFVNIPIGIASLILLWKLLPADSELKKTKFDFLGAFFLSAGATLLLLGLSSGESNLGQWRIPTVALSGIVLLVIFPITENKTEKPIIPMLILKKRSFTLPLIGILTSSAAGSGLLFFTPFFLEYQLGLPPTQIGMSVLALPLAMTLMAQVGGLLTDRLGPKISAAMGAMISLIGLLLYSMLHTDWSIMDVMWRLFIVGVGFGMLVGPNNVAVMAATPREFVGVSSAVTNVFRSLGFAVGPALATMVWTPTKNAPIFSMHAVVYVIIATQIITLFTIFWYRKHTSAA